MSKYTIIEYSEHRNNHKLKSHFTGDIIHADLFVDSSFENSPINGGMAMEEYLKACHAMAGMTVEIEDLYPCEYIASGVKLINQ